MDKRGEEAEESIKITGIQTTDKQLKVCYEERQLPERVRLQVQIDDHICQWLANTHHGLKISKSELVENALAHFLPDYFKPDTIKQSS